MPWRDVGRLHRWCAVSVAVATIATLTAVIIPTGNADAPGDAMNCPVTAATTHGWPPAQRISEFDDVGSLAGWEIYDSPGHRRNGRRTPRAISVADGYLTITGDAAGDSGGMAWHPGQLFGRWEACMKSPPAAQGYESVLLLWPDANDWPIGGEIDFVEIADPARQRVEAYLHFGPNDQWESGMVLVDATAWHSWAVEWTPFEINVFVDGTRWWTTPNRGQFPPRPLHLCIQLDNVGGDISQGGQLNVDWVRQYSWS